MTDNAALEHLPDSLREIAELIGLAPALKLVEHWGGVRLYIPETVQPTHTLAIRIGITAARKLSQRYAREEIWVPRAARWMIAVRDAEICELFPDVSAPKLARKYGLTERQVRLIIAANTENPQQSLL